MDITQTLEKRVRYLYDTYGQRKSMGLNQPDTRQPLFFLHRPFLCDQDLLVIFNTKRCRYQCDFCQLPIKSPVRDVPTDEILAQFEYVMNELKHSLSVLTRITLSNEGSVLDNDTFSTDALVAIARSVRELRLVRRLVIETRIEFIELCTIGLLKQSAPRTVLDILVGFETLDAAIRDDILTKQESIDVFLSGLDRVAAAKCDLTAYVLFKPSPYMSDSDAFSEAETSIDFLATECGRRGIPLTIRLNPMYAATGSHWAERARRCPGYQPPRLTDVIRLADKKTREGLGIYIGLSTEGLDENWGTYLAREDYSRDLIKPIKRFNDGHTDALQSIL